jgi:hypothetical protein
VPRKEGKQEASLGKGEFRKNERDFCFVLVK